ncbi:MAG: hypothetical protein R3E53_21320 [Myxococcota bacterium]
MNVAPRIDPTATARPRLALPAGRHRVLAVRGPEYAAAEVTVDVRPGRTSALPLAALAPPRADRGLDRPPTSTCTPA